MDKEKLREFITKKISEGHDQDKIKKFLISKGIREEEILEVFFDSFLTKSIDGTHVAKPHETLRKPEEEKEKPHQISHGNFVVDESPLKHHEEMLKKSAHLSNKKIPGALTIFIQTFYNYREYFVAISRLSVLFSLFSLIILSVMVFVGLFSQDENIKSTIVKSWFSISAVACCFMPLAVQKYINDPDDGVFRAFLSPLRRFFGFIALSLLLIVPAATSIVLLGALLFSSGNFLVNVAIFIVVLLLIFLTIFTFLMFSSTIMVLEGRSAFSSAALSATYFKGRLLYLLLKIGWISSVMSFVIILIKLPIAYFMRSMRQDIDYSLIDKNGYIIGMWQAFDGSVGIAYVLMLLLVVLPVGGISGYLLYSYCRPVTNFDEDVATRQFKRFLCILWGMTIILVGSSVIFNKPSMKDLNNYYHKKNRLMHQPVKITGTT